MTDRKIPPEVAEDDLSFMDLFQILMRRKLVIVVSVFLCLMGGSAYLLIVTPLYEASATLRVGEVAESGSLEDPEVLSAVLLGKYREEIATGIKRPPPFLKSAVVQRSAKQVLDLVVRGETPEQAVEFLRYVAEEAIAKHREIYMSKMDIAYRRIEQIKKQQKQLHDLLTGTAGLLDKIKQRDPVQASLLTAERGRIATELADIDRDLPKWQDKLIAPKTVMTELIGDVVAPENPVTPKKLVAIIVSVILGLALGVALAFLAEFGAAAGEKMAD